MESDQLRHDAPAWAFQADDELVTHEEIIPVRRSGDGRDREICAVPFRLGRLALGDVVRPDENGYTVRSRSGHGTAMVWLGDSYLPRDQLTDELQGLGAVMERHGDNLLAVDLAPSTAQEVLTLLRGYADQQLLRMRLSQPALPALTAEDDAALASRVGAFARARAEHLGPDRAARIEEILAGGQSILALENLLPGVLDAEITLTPPEHAELVHLAALAGLPVEMLPSYGISLRTPSPGGPGRALATIVATSQAWEAVELQWPDGERFILPAESTASDSQSFRLGTLPPARLLVVGPATAEVVGDYVVVSDFSYAEVVRQLGPFRSVGKVVTEGEIVLAAAGAPEYHSSEAANTSAKVDERFVRLRDLLAAPGSLKRLTVRWTWGELFLPMAFAIPAAIASIGVSAERSSALPLLGLLVALAAMLLPVAYNRWRRARAQRLFAAQGWLATGNAYPSRTNRLVHLLLPVEMPYHQRVAVAERLGELLSDPTVAGQVESRLRTHVTRGFSARELDPALPSKAIVHGLTQAHPQVACYAVVPRAEGAVVDVLAVRPGALRATGLSD